MSEKNNVKSDDHVARLREQIAAQGSKPGFHPIWSSSPVMADEPLWGISFREPGEEKWVGGYRTATRDLDEAIDEARRYLQISPVAEVSVYATVPRSDTYKGAESTLFAMLVAVPLEHAEAPAMLRQIRAAMKTVAAAKEEGRYIGPLRLEFPIALEVDELNLGRPQPIKVITWGDRDDWPEWNRCTLPANS